MAGIYASAAAGRRARHDERRRLREGDARLGDEGREELPHVRQVGPRLQHRGAAGCAHLVHETSRIVAQEFRIADLRKERREAVQLRIERRDERVRRRRGAVVERGAGPDAVGVEHRAAPVVLRDRRPRGGEVGPRREEKGAGGERIAGVAQDEERRERQPAAGRITADREQRRRHALRVQPAHRSDRIVHRGRERMLRGPPVLERKDARTGHRGEGGRDWAMRLGGAEQVAASVEIEHDASALAPRRMVEPLAKDRRAGLRHAAAPREEPPHRARLSKAAPQFRHVHVAAGNVAAQHQPVVRAGESGLPARGAAGETDGHRHARSPRVVDTLAATCGVGSQTFRINFQ